MSVGNGRTRMRGWDVFGGCIWIEGGGGSQMRWLVARQIDGSEIVKGICFGCNSGIRFTTGW